MGSIYGWSTILPKEQELCKKIRVLAQTTWAAGSPHECPEGDEVYKKITWYALDRYDFATVEDFINKHRINGGALLTRRRHSRLHSLLFEQMKIQDAGIHSSFATLSLSRNPT